MTATGGGHHQVSTRGRRRTRPACVALALLQPQHLDKGRPDRQRSGLRGRGAKQPRHTVRAADAMYVAFAETVRATLRRTGVRLHRATDLECHVEVMPATE